MGVPVVTLAGNRFAGRMSASVLTSLGLNDLIAHSADRYVEIASALQTIGRELARLRLELRTRSAPVAAVHARRLGKRNWKNRIAGCGSIGRSPNEQRVVHLDTSILLAHDRASHGLYPAVDPLASTSRLLDPAYVGERHYQVAMRVKQALERYRQVKDIISMLGMQELRPEDQQTVLRARRLQASGAILDGAEKVSGTFIVAKQRSSTPVLFPPFLFPPGSRFWPLFHPSVAITRGWGRSDISAARTSRG